MKYKIMLLMLILSFSMLFAENYVVINSRNGLDVLSGIYYANVKGEPSKFMPLSSTVALTVAKIGNNHDILLIQSKTLPTNTFLESELKKTNTVTVLESDDALATNLQLADRSGTDKFIIIDPSFGQNALSVLPYAAKTKSFVIFAYSGNVNDVATFLDRKAKKVTIFGYVDSDTKKKLAKYNPDIIGNGEDKYEDNIIIADIIMRMSPDDKQVFFADGTFIEEGMIEGKYPIVFVSAIVPKATYDFLKDKVKNGELKSAILIGNSLLVPTYDLRKRIINELQAEGYDATFGVVVKFGQSVGGGTIMALDTFPLPYYVVGLTIDKFQYNTATKKLELVVKSTAEGPEYFQNQIRIKINGAEYQAISDPEPRLLERGQVMGSEYAFTLPDVPEGNITADIIVRFGETAKSMQDYAFMSSPIATIAFTDKSAVVIVGVTYNKNEKTLLVSLKNNGTQHAFATVSAELNIDGQKTIVKSSQVSKIEVDSITAVAIPVELDEQELADNKEVKIVAKYGAREGFLQKTTEAVVSLVLPAEAKEMDLLTISLIGLVILLILALLYFATRTWGSKRRIG